MASEVILSPPSPTGTLVYSAIALLFNRRLRRWIRFSSHSFLAPLYVFCDFTKHIAFGKLVSNLNIAQREPSTTLPNVQQECVRLPRRPGSWPLSCGVCSPTLLLRAEAPHTEITMSQDGPAGVQLFSFDSPGIRRPPRKCLSSLSIIAIFLRG